MTFNITFNDVLRAAIAEQIKPPVMQQAPDTAAQAKTRLITFDAKKIAKLIYDAKGTFIDDEDVAVVGKSMEARLRRMAAAVADARD